jgi:hypothetical protein
MASNKRETHSPKLALRVTDLAIPDEKKAELENSAENMADLADSLDYLDPLDEEPSLVFDPRV